MSDSNNYKYFLATTKNKTALTVIDLHVDMLYEREDWATVNNINYTDLEEALRDAHQYAFFNNLTYQPFESRYNSELNEKPKPVYSPTYTSDKALIDAAFTGASRSGNYTRYIALLEELVTKYKAISS